MAVHCLRCGKTRRGDTRRPCPTPDCHGKMMVCFPHRMRKIVTQFYKMGFDVRAAYTLTPVVPYDDGITDATLYVCLSFDRLYEEDCFPELPDAFTILHFDEYNSTRLSHYAEYFCGDNILRDAKKDEKMLIETLWKYGKSLEERKIHFLLQMAGRL